MKYFSLIFLNVLFPFQSIWAQVGLSTIDDKINYFFKPISDFVCSIVFYSISIRGDATIPIVLLLLILVAIFFTLYFRFPNVRFFKLSIDIVRGKYTHSSSENKTNKEKKVLSHGKVQGEVSHFQALTVALSATVGLGNIAGVAVAISMGGPGATFWMILAGFLGMSTKFVECTLGVRYREVGADGTIYGGAMYYLSKGLARKGWKKMGKVCAVFFALMCIGGSFGAGNMFQANQAFKQLASLPFLQGTWIVDNAWCFGIFLSVLVGGVIIGGIKSIANVTGKIVPFMAVVYVGAAIFILGVNFKAIPQAFMIILEGAFAPKAIAGGIIGVLVQGFKRAAFSNESGIGSAAIVHSAVRTKYPASEGIVALLEPFIDTVVICTMTALVIVLMNFNTGGELLTYGQGGISSTSEGISLTSRAFSTGINGFQYVLTVAVLLFAFSTFLSWSYYGLQSWMYLFGRSKWVENTYKVIFCFFIIVGASISLDTVINFADAMIFAMMIPNIIGLFVLAPEVKEELVLFLNKVQSGESDNTI